MAGHKDKEIGRINSKLKACEDHITQLLKIQNRARAKPLTGLVGAGGTRASVEATKGGLSLADHEHFVTSKSILDNLVIERVEVCEAPHRPCCGIY